MRLWQHVRCPNCGQPLQAHRQFNNYRLIALLGEGGMGSVFKAVDLNLNREVALKILKKECSANEEERAKLEEEARITASINHPHVVKVFSFGEDHGQFYLAMELAEKGSLDDLMGIQQRVAEIQVLQIGIQIAEGLDAALERNLIHRDIKPGNILFSDPHTAKLVDFGLAIVMDEAAHARGEIWGTPYYIAPEKLEQSTRGLPQRYLQPWRNSFPRAGRTPSLRGGSGLDGRSQAAHEPVGKHSIVCPGRFQ